MSDHTRRAQHRDGQQRHHAAKEALRVEERPLPGASESLAALQVVLEDEARPRTADKGRREDAEALEARHRERELDDAPQRVDVVAPQTGAWPGLELRRVEDVRRPGQQVRGVGAREAQVGVERSTHTPDHPCGVGRWERRDEGVERLEGLRGDEDLDEAVLVLAEEPMGQAARQ